MATPKSIKEYVLPVDSPENKCEKEETEEKVIEIVSRPKNAKHRKKDILRAAFGI